MRVHNRISEATAYLELLRDSASTLDCEKIDLIAKLLYQAYEQDKTIFLFGNGGSASLASHFACDLSKGTSDQKSIRRRLRVLAFTDNLPTITAWANDSSYDDIFAEQLQPFVRPGDVVVAVSCSGNSQNVLKALRLAKAAGAITIGLGGFEGGRMKSLCDSCLVVGSDNMQIIEDLHLSIAHCLFTLVRNRIIAQLEAEAVAASA